MTDLQTPVSNGAKTVPLYRKLADELEATMSKLGKDSRAPYLKLVKAIEAFPAKEREQVLGDLRKLWDAVGTDGKNDAKLASARKFIDDEWASR
jgi:hypothetical protein